MQKRTNIAVQWWSGDGGGGGGRGAAWDEQRFPRASFKNGNNRLTVSVHILPFPDHCMQRWKLRPLVYVYRTHSSSIFRVILHRCGSRCCMAQNMKIFYYHRYILGKRSIPLETIYIILMEKYVSIFTSSIIEIFLAAGKHVSLQTHSLWRCLVGRVLSELTRSYRSASWRYRLHSADRGQTIERNGKGDG